MSCSVQCSTQALVWSCISWIEAAGLRLLFFRVLCLLVVWGGNDAGREMLGVGVGCILSAARFRVNGTATELERFGVCIQLLRVEMAVALRI